MRPGRGPPNGQWGFTFFLSECSHWIRMGPVADMAFPPGCPCKSEMIPTRHCPQLIIQCVQGGRGSLNRRKSQFPMAALHVAWPLLCNLPFPALEP